MLRINDAGNVVFVRDWTVNNVGRGWVKSVAYHIDADMLRVQTGLLYGSVIQPSFWRTLCRNLGIR